MKLPNPLLMNDWSMRKYGLIFLSATLVVLGILALEQEGFNTRGFGQLIVAAYLTFFPGILVLRCLRIHGLSTSKTFVLTIGSSIATLMFVGALSNFILPYMGIARPITFLSLTASIFFAMASLFILSYVLDRNHSSTAPALDLHEILPYLTMLFALPAIAIIGALVMNQFTVNAPLVLLLVIIAIFPLMVISRKLPQHAYPYLIMAASLALIYHRSLISSNLWGVDIFAEFYFAQNTHFYGVWNNAVYENLNAMLSIVILPNIYSLVPGMSITLVFKLIFPFLLSIVPLGIYIVLKDQMDQRIAFLGVLFFIFAGDFYGVLPAMARQEVGGLFFILLMVLLVDLDMAIKKKAWFFIAFVGALVFSHYAISYLFLFLMATFALALLFHLFKMRGERALLPRTNSFIGNPVTALVLLAIIFMIPVAWYSFVSDGSVITSLREIIDYMLSNFSTNFLTPQGSEGIKMATESTTSAAYGALKLMYFLCYFLVGVGVLAIFLNRARFRKLRFLSFIKKDETFSLLHLQNDYVLLAYPTFVIMIGIILLPNFAGNLGTIRFFHITLLILAPFLVIGIIVLFHAFSSVSKMAKATGSLNNAGVNFAALFICIFLLLSSGFVHELANDPNPSSISLSTNPQYRLETSLYSDGELAGASFIKKMHNSSAVYSDHYGYTLLRGYLFPWALYDIEIKEETKFVNGTYVYYRNANLDGTLYVIPINSTSVERPLIDIEDRNLSYMKNMTVIYSNGQSKIRYQPFHMAH